MKTKSPSTKPLPEAPVRRTPRVAAVRRITPDRPLRVWSLLLPPNLDRK